MVPSFWEKLIMIPSLEQIYKDAMIIENLYDIADLFTYTELKRAIEQWEEVSKALEELILRVAKKDIDYGRILLGRWKETLEKRDDFRLFSAMILSELIPGLKKSLNILYGPISLEGGKWFFEKSESGFLTLRDNETKKYLHSPLNPMREASDLTRKLYSYEMDEYHILGCGLGYLSYQIWEKSGKSAHIFIYEDDESMIEYANQVGVLSWIDDNMLTVITNKNVDSLLSEFCNQYRIDQRKVYISDWKVKYYTGKYGQLIDDIDFNLRTERTNSILWKINERVNKKKNPLPIKDFLSQYNYMERDCILVSAGPSLDDNIEFLRENRGKMLIIAVNTVLRRLSAENIKPDITVMLSPEDVLKEHVEGIESFTENIPLIMPLCGSKSFVALYKGPIYTIDEEDLSEEKMWDFGGTVTSLGLNVAYNLKAAAIYLIGSDLAFTSGRNFSKGVSHPEYEGLNNSIVVESSDGGTVQTNNLYNTFRDILERQIADHPEVKVYNLSEHGAKIAGTISGSL